MRISAKGQVTIPVAMRRKSGLHPGAEVEFEFDGVGVRIVRVEARDPKRGAQLVANLRGRGDGTLSTDEIVTLTRGD